mgnify:CR=1 FL=1
MPEPMIPERFDDLRHRARYHFDLNAVEVDAIINEVERLQAREVELVAALENIAECANFPQELIARRARAALEAKP